MHVESERNGGACLRGERSYDEEKDRENEYKALAENFLMDRKYVGRNLSRYRKRRNQEYELGAILAQRGYLSLPSNGVQRLVESGGIEPPGPPKVDTRKPTKRKADNYPEPRRNRRIEDRPTPEPRIEYPPDDLDPLGGRRFLKRIGFGKGTDRLMWRVTPRLRGAGGKLLRYGGRELRRIGGDFVRHEGRRLIGRAARYAAEQGIKFAARKALNIGLAAAGAKVGAIAGGPVGAIAGGAAPLLLMN